MTKCRRENPYFEEIKIVTMTKKTCTLIITELLEINLKRNNLCRETEQGPDAEVFSPLLSLRLSTSESTLRAVSFQRQ
jgi:hypothetical protein